MSVDQKNTTKLSAPSDLKALVTRFSQAPVHALSEEDVRAAFINPLFKALGWPVDQIGSRREVRHEDRVRTGDGSLKAPDYGFYLRNRLKFFVEAKQPGIKIGTDPKPAFQLRRYAWSANLPVSILTDFEELAIYDCRIEPRATDSAADARIAYIHYSEYSDKWDVIAKIFSRQAVLDGSIELLASEEQRGSIAVDAAFLREIEGWREVLTAEISKNHPQILLEELAFAVEKIVDRIIFLRIAEDRGIENYGQLKLAVESRFAYKKFLQLFRQADEKYNSGVFHFRPEKGRHTDHDDITPELKISDSALKKIVDSLYYPKPYVFAAIPADILGRIYEQFLGKVIRLTADGPRIVEKPEVRKAGGVYYTPLEVVDWMIERCLRPMVENKTPRQIESLRILDPACGSGTFLIAAFDYLLQYHLDWYIRDDAEKWSRPKNQRLFQGAGDEWHLSISEKKRILTNNIFGVDIDPQAVEVAKLSLLLKVLEGEAEQVLQLQMFQERALPDLGANIKCGNSLISFDVGELLPSSTDEIEPINSFSWNQEFSEVFGRGNPGFDVVIGNPPYVDSEWMTVYRPTWRKYIKKRYAAASGNWDLFCPFVEKSISLLRKKGLHSFIVPNKLISAEYASATRKLLSEDNRLLEVRDYSAVPVFPVSVYPIIYVVERVRPKVNTAQQFSYTRLEGASVTLARLTTNSEIDYSIVETEGGAWPIFGNVDSSDLLTRIEQATVVAEKVATILGAATVSEAYTLLPLISNSSEPKDNQARIVNSGTIDPLCPLWGTKPLRYLKETFPNPVVDLDKLQGIQPKRAIQASTPKVVIAGMTKRLEVVADTSGAYLAAKSTTVLFPKLGMSVEYLAGLLSSNLMNFVFRKKFGGLSLSGGYLRVGPPQIKKLPIYVIDQQDDRDLKLAQELVEQVHAISNASIEFARVRVPSSKKVVERRLANSWTLLNRAVYSLYKLDDHAIDQIEAEGR